MASRRRAWLKTAHLVVANTLLLALGLELGFRACAPARDEVASATRRDIPYSLHPYFQTTFPPDAGTVSGEKLAGWRVDPSIAALESEPVRVLYLGGSTTANLYPHYTRRMLLGNKVRSAGVVLGYDWHCSLHTLHKLWTYGDEVRPDLVVVLEGVNDFYRGFTSPDAALPVYRTDYSHHAGGLYPFWSAGEGRWDGRPVFYARPSPAFAGHERFDTGVGAFFRDALERSVLVATLRGVDADPPEPLRAAMPDELVLRALPEYRRNLRNIAQTCRAKGWPALFLTMPWCLGSGRTFLPPGRFFTNDGVHHLDDAGFARGMRAFNDETRKLGAELGERVLDLEAELRDPALFADEVHLNDEGQKAQAKLVGGWILASGLLKAGAAK